MNSYYWNHYAVVPNIYGPQMFNPFMFPPPSLMDSNLAHPSSSDTGTSAAPTEVQKNDNPLPENGSKPQRPIDRRQRSPNMHEKSPVLPTRKPIDVAAPQDRKKRIRRKTRGSTNPLMNRSNCLTAKIEV